MKKSRDVIFLLLGAALFLVLLRRAGPPQLWQTLAGQGWRFLLVLLPTALSFFFFCAAWWLLLDPGARREVPLSRLFLISVAGSSLNYLTPFVALGGEPLKAVYLARYLGNRRAIATVVTYNILHILSHLFVYLGAAGLGLRLLEPTPARTLALMVAILLLTGLIVLLLAFHRGGLFDRLGKIGRWVLSRGPLPRALPLPLRERLLGRCQEWTGRLQPFDDDLTEAFRFRPVAFWAALGLDFLGRVVWTAELSVMMSNAGRWLDPLRAFVAHSLSGLMMILTFYVPYEVGVKEGGFYLCLHWLGQEPSLGIYLGVASRLRELVWIVVSLGIVFALGLRGRAKAPVAAEEGAGPV